MSKKKARFVKGLRFLVRFTGGLDFRIVNIGSKVGWEITPYWPV